MGWGWGALAGVASHGLMGNAAGRGAEKCSAALAAGRPEELDWQGLIKQVFSPAQQAVLLLTSEALANPSGGGQPCKVVECYRGAEEVVAKEVFDPHVLNGRVGLVSQKGKKSAPNQDSAFYLEFLDSDGSKVWLACVMDGHGPLGHEMSRLVMQWLPLLVLRDPLMAKDVGCAVPKDPQTVFDAITAAFSKMGSLMRRASAGTFEKELSGTTCVFALCARGLLHSANVGDSRAVLGQLCDKPGASAFSLGLEVRPLTRDHKPEDVEERLRIEGSGGIVERQRVYNQNYPYVGLNLSRSFGDTMMHNVGVSHTPDVATTFLDDEGQFLVLASDGVWEFLSSQDAAESIGKHLQDAGRSSASTSSQGGGSGLAPGSSRPSVAEQPPPAAQGAALRLLGRSADEWRRQTDEMDDITVLIVRI